jgi:hypothetical protein
MVGQPHQQTTCFCPRWLADQGWNLTVVGRNKLEKKGSLKTDYVPLQSMDLSQTILLLQSHGVLS